MKVLGILFKFFWKMLLICIYMLTKAGELLLTAFNNAFKQLLDK